uniref:BHLH domain-containing protein n=1 Tax=Kalanchoe fedtschenkoi TaxID=63787 RepID=A0A7N0U1N3_KALFE
MMEDNDVYGSQTFHHNHLLFHQHQQQDITIMQPPFSSSSSFDPAYNPFLIPPPPSFSHSCTYTPDHYMSSNLSTNDHGALGSSSLLGSMLSQEFEKMRSMDMMEAKALAASRNHSEAERKRRERINSHLTKLRSLLPNTTKTDKASLLAEVIQCAKHLKQQTSALSELHTVPTEADDLTFETCATRDGQLLIKASLCCEDRSDVLQDLISTFQALNLKIVKADMTTFGGRMKYVVFIVGDSDQTCGQIEDAADQPFVVTIQEAFRDVMGRSLGKLDNKGPSSDYGFKRRRVKGECQRSLDAN